MNSPANDAIEAVLRSRARGVVVLGDRLDTLRCLPDESVDLIYIDPPFNTGKRQRLDRLRATASPDGTRVGFGGRHYLTTRIGSTSYADHFDDYLSFLEPCLKECHRILKTTGSLYFHIDYREVHYCKILLDTIFGRGSFINEIIWAYDYGARSKTRWPAKHDNILLYAKSPEGYFFDIEAVERIPYMAPGLVGPEKAARGKTPTDTWWHTIVPTNGKERTGYPTQKPVGVVKRALEASCPPGGLVVDVFAGSGTTGEAAASLGQRFILGDHNPEAVDVMRKRFSHLPDVAFVDESTEATTEEHASEGDMEAAS